MKYTYTGYNTSGFEVTGEQDARSEPEALDMLHKQGITVVAISSANVSKQGTQPRQRKKKSINKRMLADFARELGILVSTGTPLIDAMYSIKHQFEGDTMERVLDGVLARLEEGDSFSQALESEHESFDAVFRSLIAAGESSGCLDSMLMRIAALTRKEAHIRSNIIGAMMYPILLTFIALVVMVVLILIVLPRFANMFATLDTELPMTTAWLMMLSEFIRGYWWVLLPLLLLLLFSAYHFLHSQRGHDTISRVSLNIPKLGMLVRSFTTAKITRLLGVLLDAKVPMLDAILLTKDSMTMDQYRCLLSDVEAAVTHGEPISNALSNSDLILSTACEAIRNGEHTGKLSEVLLHISDYLDEDNDTVIRTLSTLIEPIIMIGLGLLVGFVAISMFLPLFDLTAATG